MSITPSRGPFVPVEKRVIVLAALAAFLLITQQVAARATRDALFLQSWRVSSLPEIMMASAVAAVLGAEAMSRAISRISPARALPLLTATSALLLLVEWAATFSYPRPAAALVYLHVAAFGGALVSGFWSLVNERFDPHTARRVVARIGTGAALGGVAGGALAFALSRVLPVAAALPAVSLLQGLAAASLLLLRPGGGDRRVSETTTATREGPFRLFRRVPYLRDLALVVGLAAFVEALVDYLFKAHAASIYPGGNALFSVFALFHGAVSVIGVALQAALARPALSHLGIAGTAALRPALTAVGAVAGTALPGLGTATVARGAHESLSNSLFRSAYELLYTPLPEVEKRRVKAVIDVAVDKGGALLGAAVIFAAIRLVSEDASRALFPLAALVCVAVLALTPRLHSGYVRALERSLLTGQVRLEAAEVVDRATRVTMSQSSFMGDRESLLGQIEALRAAESGASAVGDAADRTSLPHEDEALQSLADLRSRDPRRVRQVLRAHPEPSALLAAELIPLLGVDQLAPDVLRALRRAAPRLTGQLVDALLDPRTDTTVRRRLPRVLKACPTRRAADGLLAALQDESFAVRDSAALALAALVERSSALQAPREEVFTLARLALENPRGGERGLPHVFTLLSLAVEREPLRISWAALRSEDPGLRGTALEYLETVLPEEVRRPLWRRLGARPAAPAARPQAQVVDELLHSSVGLKLEQPPWRSADEG
jgi:hypothetical protein